MSSSKASNNISKKAKNVKNQVDKRLARKMREGGVSQDWKKDMEIHKEKQKWRQEIQNRKKEIEMWCDKSFRDLKSRLPVWVSEDTKKEIEVEFKEEKEILVVLVANDVPVGLLDLIDEMIGVECTDCQGTFKKEMLYKGICFECIDRVEEAQMEYERNYR